MPRLCNHSNLCKCFGEVTEPEILDIEIRIDGKTYRMANLGFSRHPDGKNKWYVYFRPYRCTKNRRRITRMGVKAWRKSVRNPN